MDLARWERHRWRFGRPRIRATYGARWSVIGADDYLYDDTSAELVEVLLTAANAARSISLGDIEARSSQVDARWVRGWPGEHYRLLAALVRLLAPATAVEVGTFRGHGALALAAGSSTTRVVTYDIVAWDDIADSALKPGDFVHNNGQIEQRLGDLGESAYLRSQVETLRAADLVFIDGPKDGIWEAKAIPPLLDALTDRRRLVVLDDIRLLPMVQLWRELPYAKLDATSLGHWSGTGFLFTA